MLRSARLTTTCYSRSSRSKVDAPGHQGSVVIEAEVSRSTIRNNASGPLQNSSSLRSQSQSARMQPSPRAREPWRSSAPSKASL